MTAGLGRGRVETTVKPGGNGPTPGVPSGVILCWTISLDIPSTVLETGAGWLDPTERARAGRYHFDHHRRRFIARRAARRWILGKLLGLAPALVPFREVGTGKPEVVGGNGACIHFSGSHSEDLAVVAVCGGAAIGVDVEVHRLVEASLWEVRHLFGDKERSAMERVSERDRARVFFDCWTRKEACVKADGAGLEISLDSFEVPVGPLEAGVQVTLANGYRPDAVVKLLPIQLGDGVSAALAVEGDGAYAVEVRAWDWSDVQRI